MSVPLVTRDLTGNFDASIAAGGSLLPLVQSTANNLAAGVLTPEIQSNVVNLLQNGIPPITPQGMGAALQAGLADLGTLAPMGPIPRFLLNVGGGAGAGALVGGPYGAAVGAVGGLFASIPLLFAKGPRFNDASAAQKELLHTLQEWIASHPSHLNEPIGWHLYDYAAMNFRTSKVAPAVAPTLVNPVAPICTPFLFGGVTEPCSDLGTFSASPPGTNSRELIGVEIGATTLVSPVSLPGAIDGILARLPDPFFYAVVHPDDTPFSHPAVTLPLGPSQNETQVNYGWTFMLGTIFAMLAAGASDQSIASELVLEQYTLHASGDVQGAQSVQPLVDEFLRRLPSAADHAVATAGGRTLGAIGHGAIHAPGLAPGMSLQAQADAARQTKKSWLGAALGAGAGFLVFGPFGALAGAALAYWAANRQGSSAVASPAAGAPAAQASVSANILADQVAAQAAANAALAAMQGRG